MSDVILPPTFNELHPEPTPEEKTAREHAVLQQLSDELKDWKNAHRRGHQTSADKEVFWKRMDGNKRPIPVEIPVVESLEQAIQYANIGTPTWISEDGVNKRFGPKAIYDMVREAHEFILEEHIATIERQEAIASNRLKSVADMIKSPKIDWLVEGRVHRSGLFQIFGASYAGKTLLVLDLVMSWCAGLPEWQGYKLNNDGKPQDAVYVAAEGGPALAVHVDAWLKYHSDVDPSRLAGLLFLDGGEGHNMFIGTAKQTPDADDSFSRLKQEIALAGITPSIVVFDTQIDLAPGVDENSNTDMVGVLRDVKRLGDSYGFMAIVIHHTGHDGNKARGASGMMGKCDVQAKLSTIGDKSGKAKLEWTKVKGAALPEETISYEIKGRAKLPELDSLGAVCVPLDRLASAIDDWNSKEPGADLQRSIMQALTDGPLSARKLSEAVGIDRNNKAFKDAVEWMTYSAMLTETGEGRSAKIGLAQFAVAPEDPAINS